MKHLRLPSPAMVVACLALFVATSGVSYAVATIGSDDIVNGSIRNRDFKDGTLRGQEAKRDGFGGGAIKERSLNAAELDADDIGKVDNAGTADGLARHGVISEAGAIARGRGITAASKTGAGQYQVVFDRDVTGCTYFATLGDVASGTPGAGEVSVASAAGNVSAVHVVTRDSAGAIADRSFHLTVSC